MPRGFASLSKDRKVAISTKGGKAVQEQGVGFKFNATNSKYAAMRGVAKRKQKQARAAAIRLLEAGFTASQLHSLKLSEDELIYFGGSKRSHVRIKELITRLESINGSKTESDIRSTPEPVS